jgi:putative ABC transport system substrate-binding protein
MARDQRGWSAIVCSRRKFLRAAASSFIITLPLAVGAEPAVRVARIGFLGSGSDNPISEPFRQGLRELGWVQGQNVLIDYRFAEGSIERLPDLAAELIQRNVDVIVAVATPSSLAAKRATRTIPVVMVAAGDPVAAGLVTNLARPDGNVTGLSFDVNLESFTKSLELFKQASPNSRRVAVLINPANPAQHLAEKNLRVAAQHLGIQLHVLEARGPEEFDAAFAVMSKDGLAGVLVVTDPIYVSNRARLAELALKHRLPSMHGVRAYVEAGGLMSYGPNIADLYRRASAYVDKILRGAKPRDLPVEQPSKFELIINLKTAKALGLTIPQAVLLRADEVIQ